MPNTPGSSHLQLLSSLLTCSSRGDCQKWGGGVGDGCLEWCLWMPVGCASTGAQDWTGCLDWGKWSGCQNGAGARWTYLQMLHNPPLASRNFEPNFVCRCYGASSFSGETWSEVQGIRFNWCKYENSWPFCSPLTSTTRNLFKYLSAGDTHLFKYFVFPSQPSQRSCLWSCSKRENRHEQSVLGDIFRMVSLFCVAGNLEKQNCDQGPDRSDGVFLGGRWVLVLLALVSWTAETETNDERNRIPGTYPSRLPRPTAVCPLPFFGHLCWYKWQVVWILNVFQWPAALAQVQEKEPVLHDSVGFCCSPPEFEPPRKILRTDTASWKARHQWVRWVKQNRVQIWRFSGEWSQQFQLSSRHLVCLVSCNDTTVQCPRQSFVQGFISIVWAEVCFCLVWHCTQCRCSKRIFWRIVVQLKFTELRRGKACWERDKN